MFGKSDYVLYLVKYIFNLIILPFNFSKKIMWLQCNGSLGALNKFLLNSTQGAKLSYSIVAHMAQLHGHPNGQRSSQRRQRFLRHWLVVGSLL